MAIDKGLSESPFNPVGGDGLGMSVDLQPTEGLNDNAVEMQEDGSAVIDLEKSKELDKSNIPFDANLAEYMEEGDLQHIGRKICEWVEADDRARSKWKKMYIDGLDLLGLTMEDRTDPWQGACGVYHPILMEQVVRFQSQAIMEIFPAGGPVKTKIIGKWTREKEQQAERVKEELNYYTTEKMTEFRSETEKLLLYLGLSGSAFRKRYYDKRLNRPVAVFVPAEDFIVPYGTSDLRTTPRYTHQIKAWLNDIKIDTKEGLYREVDLQKPIQQTTEIAQKKSKLEGVAQTFELDEERYVLNETSCNWDLPGFEDEETDEVTGETYKTGIALPYVITVERESQKVLAIYRNWDKDDPGKVRTQHFTPYEYLPGLGFYGFGLVHLIGGIAKAATSGTRQLIDAGTLSNLPGGLKTRGLRIKGDDTPIQPGEFRDVDVPSGVIRDNITFLPYKEPSQVLFQLMQNLVEEGRKLGAAPDLPISAMTQQAPVGTTLALLERAMKVMSAVQARLHASLKLDLQGIAKLIADHEGSKYEYEVNDPNADRKVDFSKVDIIPVSDPNAASMAQRVVQYQAALQLAQADPQSFDRPLIYRDMLTMIGLPNVDKAVKDPSNIEPMDPVTENMALIAGKPVKAYLWQDQQAHITTHLAAIHDPKIAAMVGQSPQGQAIMASAAAHIAEHLGFAYRQEIEKQMGVPLPPPDRPLPPEIEVQLSRAVAVAAQRLLGKDIQEAQAAANAQKQQDPVIQQQNKELEIKAAGVKQKDDADKRRFALAVMELLAKDYMQDKKQAADARIAGAALGVKIGIEQADLKHRDQAETVKAIMGLIETHLGTSVDVASLELEKKRLSAEGRSTEH